MSDHHDKARPHNSQAGRLDANEQVLKGASKFERYAATQAAADGIEGDVKKPNKSEAEKLAAQMADAK